MMPNCEICGHPMPIGEEMFRYHGYSGKCPASATQEWRERPFKERGRIVAEHHAKLAIAKIARAPLSREPSSGAASPQPRETYTEICRNEKCPRGGKPVTIVAENTTTPEPK